VSAQVIKMRRTIMTIVRWNSSRDVAALQERMSRMLEGFYVRPQEDLTGGAWEPAVDIYSNSQHELVLKAEAVMARSRGRSRSLRRSTLAGSTLSTRPVC
jgi:hypothetical protein